MFPEFKSDVNYNEEFWKTYLKNELSFALIKELSERTSELQELVKEIEVLNTICRTSRKTTSASTSSRTERKTGDWLLKSKRSLNARMINVTSFMDLMSP